MKPIPARNRELEPAQALITSFALVNACVFAGFVADRNDPSRKFTIDLLLDGLVVKTAYADQFDPEAQAACGGDGCYGFAVPVQRSIIDHAEVAEARTANLGICIGAPLKLRDVHIEPAAGVSADRLRWLGGLRFSGWVSDSAEPIVLKVVVNGEPIMQVRTLGWAQPDGDIQSDRPVRAFDFSLSERFADGCVRWLSVVRESGDVLSDSPLPFVAFADGLAATIRGFAELDSERLRAEMYDHLVPMSLPMSHYQRWQERFPSPEGHPSDLRCGVVLVGQRGIDVTLESLEGQSHAHWAACALEDEGDGVSFQADQVRGFLAEDAADSEFVVFALNGTVFEPNALQRIAEVFSDSGEALAVYGDFNIVGSDGGVWPLALSAFDYERLLEQGYCAHLFALRRAVALNALSTSPPNLFRLFNALFDDGLANASKIVVHLPGGLGKLPALYPSVTSRALVEATAQHLAVREIKADVSLSPPGLFPAARVKRHVAKDKTTIIIPTRDRLALLRDCLESIQPALEKTGAEVIVVDNDSAEPTTLAFLKKLQGKSTRVIRVPGPFNFARLNNVAARESRSEYLCLLNNDIKALDGDWLEELQSRIGEADVGAVGAMLAWPSGMVQHGGVVLGPNFAATHAFNDRTVDDPGYADLLRAAHEVSAVTAACMLTRRSDYLSVGGMDEMHFPVSFNDVDYCLKLRELGKRIVFTPHAKLTHLEVSQPRPR